MPTFATPEPISTTIELSVGNIRISAGERTDTVVDVRPTDPNNASDVRAAEQTRVEFSGGTLTIKGARPRALDWSNKSRSVDVTIDLPNGSAVNADVVVADYYCTGPLADCQFKSSTGHVQLDRTGPLQLNTSVGNVTVERVDGHAEVSTGSGKVRIGELRGTGVIKNSNGGTEIGVVTGKVRIRSANGDIAVDQSGDNVEARTANGHIRLGDAARGPLVLETSMGNVEVGIREGIAAWLDVKTGFGRVDSALDSTTTGPGPSEDSIELRARTTMGDITIRRA